jgi:hypothetical protein
MRTYHRSAGWVPRSGTCPPGFKFSTGHGCSYFSRFISGFNGAMLLVISDVGAYGDFVNLMICLLSPSEVLIGVWFVYVCLVLRRCS